MSGSVPNAGGGKDGENTEISKKRSWSSRRKTKTFFQWFQRLLLNRCFEMFIENPGRKQLTMK